VCTIKLFLSLVYWHQFDEKVLVYSHSKCFLWRLKDIEKGYWDFVSYFTRMDAIKMINKLTQVTTDLGKGNFMVWESCIYCTIHTGRAWLYLSLNEQATESYLRMFLEYQEQVAMYYNPWVDHDSLLCCYLCHYREAFLSDAEVCVCACMHAYVHVWLCVCVCSILCVYSYLLLYFT